MSGLTAEDTLGPQGATAPGPLTIALADDHALVRGGLALMVRSIDSQATILEAGTCARAREILAANEVDLLLLDFLIPGLEGTEGIRALRAEFPEVPIIVISVRDDIATIRAAIHAGAAGYVPKSSEPSVTLMAIRLVMSGGIYIPPHVLGISEDIETPDDPPAGEAPPSGVEDVRRRLDLTERQFEVLRLMAEGMTNKAIAERLDLTPGTVKMHISNILRAIGVENRTTAVARYNTLMARSGPPEG